MWSTCMNQRDENFASDTTTRYKYIHSLARFWSWENIDKLVIFVVVVSFMRTCKSLLHSYFTWDVIETAISAFSQNE